MHKIVIDVPNRQLHLYDSNQMVNSFPIAVGKPATLHRREHIPLLKKYPTLAESSAPVG